MVGKWGNYSCFIISRGFKKIGFIFKKNIWLLRKRWIRNRRVYVEIKLNR